MARVVGGRGCVLLKVPKLSYTQKANFSVKNATESFKKLPIGKKIIGGIAGTLTTGAVGLGIAIHTTVVAGELQLHPPHFPWANDGVMKSFDHESVRRGYQVYKQVCAACHSMHYMHYRNLVGAIMTEDEAKAEAADQLIPDGPDDQGNMFERPAKLADKFPNPYPNDEAAKAANNGALPPDLSLISLARHGGEDYIFSLLTGYCDAPPGVTLQEGQHYNPYFPGGAISMAQALYNEIIEYEDGTPATASQCAKDVCAFLAWSAEPEHDTRKRMALKAIMLFSTFFLVSLYLKKHKFSALKSKKISYNPRSK